MTTPTSSMRRASPLAALRAQIDNVKIAGRPLTWYLSGWRGGVIWLVIALLVPTIIANFGDVIGLDESFILTLIIMGVYAILALGLNIVVGYAGLLDLGYVAFFVIGAYTMAFFSGGVIHDAAGKAHEFPTIGFWWLIPLGAVLAGAAGVLLGAPTLRLRGDYLAIVTLGFGEIVPIIFNNIQTFGSVGGLTANKPDPVNTPLGTLDFSSFADNSAFYYLTVVLVALIILLVTALRNSSMGRAWIAIREDETAAAASGVNLVRIKLLAFGMGAAIGGIGGVLNTAAVATHIEPGDFQFAISITVLVMIVLGGISSIPGVIVGAGLLTFFDQFVLSRISETIHDSSLVVANDAPLHFLAHVDFNQFRLLIYGILLLVMILLRPQGIIPDLRRKRELTGVGEAPEELSVVGALEQERTGESGGPPPSATQYTGSGSDAHGREGE